MTELDLRLSRLGEDHGKRLRLGILVGAVLLLVLMAAITGTLYFGLGVWGINIPVAWGFAIVNFIWWIGIGHAGTFISAILLLARQSWRSSINRVAETMTLFAVASAGLFPILHMGRPWYFYWLFPYPNDMNLYPNYRSPLTWDAFAVTTYALVSAVFWYVGLLPDLAVAREKAPRPWQRTIFSFLSLGYTGEVREWSGHKRLTLFLAILATPLVISVHTIVSLDFAAGINAGWHVTMFPPFFVIGAIYSGFAMVVLLLIFLQKQFQLEDLITTQHLEKCARMLLLSGLLLSFFYVLELFFAWYSDEHAEIAVTLARMFGEKAWAFWLMIGLNCVPVQLLWKKSWRQSPWVLGAVSLLILVGMWMERYVIVITSLMVSHLPAMKGHYTATIWDWGLYLGSMGVFILGVFVVLRFLPFIPITEVKEEQRHEGV